eukprot:9469013-Heterocapsa_arctica.AAC.1
MSLPSWVEAVVSGSDSMSGSSGAYIAAKRSHALVMFTTSSSSSMTRVRRLLLMISSLMSSGSMCSMKSDSMSLWEEAV